MHELSVCLSLLDQVRAIAAEHGASQVTRIELTVGPLSGVESDLLRSAWPMAAAGTVAVDADFIVTEADILVRCTSCNAETPARANRLGNVQQIGAVSDAAPGSVDYAMTALNFHDFHNRDPQVAQGILAQVMAALKPGGILGIIDH